MHLIIAGVLHYISSCDDLPATPLLFSGELTVSLYIIIHTQKMYC